MCHQGARNTVRLSSSEITKVLAECGSEVRAERSERLKFSSKDQEYFFTINLLCPSVLGDFCVKKGTQPSGETCGTADARNDARCEIKKASPIAYSTVITRRKVSSANVAELPVDIKGSGQKRSPQGHFFLASKTFWAFWESPLSPSLLFCETATAFLVRSGSKCRRLSGICKGWGIYCLRRASRTFFWRRRDRGLALSVSPSRSFRELAQSINSSRLGSRRSHPRSPSAA